MKSLEIIVGKMKKPKKAKEDEMLAPYGMAEEDMEMSEDEALEEEGLMAAADSMLMAFAKKDSKMLVDAMKDFIAQVKSVDEDIEDEDIEEEVM